MRGKTSSLIIPRMKWSLISIDDFQVLSEFGPQNFWLFSQSIRSQEIFHSNIFVTIYYKENMKTKYILKVSWLFEGENKNQPYTYINSTINFFFFFNFFSFFIFFCSPHFPKRYFHWKKTQGLTNERPEYDHVIWWPMRGLEKIKDRQTNKHAYGHCDY